MEPDRRLEAAFGRAAPVYGLAFLLALIFAFAVLMASSALLPAGTIAGPSAAAAHPCGKTCTDECGSKCFAEKLYETREGCRRAGERALRADPYPRLDWEHYHCDPAKTGDGWVYGLFLWDMGKPG
jgi:hypothetical protein